VSQQYDNRSRGVLFKNDRKEGEKDPDYKGNLTLQDGTECWLDAWLQKSKKDGKTFMSLRYKPKMAREQGAPQNPPAQKAAPEEFDDRIPF
jgi:hypothetical protein